MHAKSKNSLGKMAALINANTAEVVDVDCFAIEAIQIFKDRKVAQIAIGIGGCDSSGKFHLDPNHFEKIARMNINSPLFDELFIDAQGNLDLNLDVVKLLKIYLNGIPGANNLVWGFNEIEIEIEEPTTKTKVTLLKKEKGK